MLAYHLGVEKLIINLGRAIFIYRFGDVIITIAHTLDKIYEKVSFIY